MFKTVALAVVVLLGVVLAGALFKPFEAHNIAEFTIEPNGETTNVTWAMYGPSPYIAKLMGLFLSMDRMVGGQVETGLANLKAITEK